jgi:hypothetical protein
MTRVALGLAAAVLVGAVAAEAEELKSGFKVGERLKPYQVVKCGGAPDDGVKEGQQLCYV